MRSAFPPRSCVWALLLLAAPPGHAAQAPAPPSGVRLLDGGPQGDGAWRAGVEIRLDPGFITYWRSAGEAGVAPVFDFSGSTNVKEARVDYPAPQLIDEDGILAYGYRRSVTFPVSIVPKDAATPIILDLSLDYAVCSKLCLPAKAHVSATLGDASPGDIAALREAWAEVPTPATLGGDGAVRIDRVSGTSPRAITVDAVSPDGTGTLFVEAPDPWYFTVSTGQPGAGGHIGFVLSAPDQPPAGPPPADPLRLTFVTPTRSIEVPVRLDAIGAKP